MAAPLSGELTFAHAVEKLAAARAAVANGTGPLELDLGGVTRVDSAGVALLLELARLAQAANRPLRLTRAPEQLRKLAQFFGVADVLSLQA